MTVHNPPLWMQGGSYSAELDRRVLAMLIRRQGPVGMGDLLVSQTSTASLSLLVAGGMLVIDGTEDTYQGRYLCENRGDATIGPLAAGHATNARKDLIVARVEDGAYPSGSSGPPAEAMWYLDVVQGTPAPSPADPVISTPNTYKLARVDVPALDSAITNSQITDLRLDTSKGLAVARGGIIITTNLQWPTTGLTEGEVLYDMSTDKYYRWSGSAWVEFPGVPTAWTAPTLLNSWVNFGAPFQVAQYRKVGDVVQCRGVIKSGNNAGGTVLFTLPAGFRPPSDIIVGVAAAASPDTTPQAGRLDIQADGDVTVAQVAAGTGVLGNAYLSLDLSFSSI